MRVPGFDEKDPQVLIQAIRELAQGGTNAKGGPFFLDVGATATVVSDPTCTSGSLVILTPLSATAAAAQAYIAAVGNGSFTVGHISTADVDRSFSYEMRR